MITENYQALLEGIEIRQNLIEIKKALKEEENRLALRYYTGNQFPILLELLVSEDGKVRKNAALILGELGGETVLEALWKAYEMEQQLYIKSSYLSAIDKMNCSILLPELKERLKRITSEEVSVESQKHISEEIRLLQRMILDLEQQETHHFMESENEYELILVTNSLHKDITKAKLATKKQMDLTAGILIKTKEVSQLMKVRTFREMLFRLPKALELPTDPADLAKQLVDSGLVTFMEKAHQSKAPYYFRIELRSKLDMEKKGKIVKAIGRELELASNRLLINSTSHYEFEIRLIERQEGNYLVLLKLFTIEDERFKYRKEFLPSSIHPVNAALTMELVKPYLTEGAQVLDPFCGVGTMLMERSYCMSANPLYGIDIYKDAITKARVNSEEAGIIVNYINKDYFDFKHEYLFDEIITYMPVRAGRKSKEDICLIYKRFFPKAKEQLRSGGLMVLYSNEPQLVKQNLTINSKDYKLLKDFLISEKDHVHVFVIRYLVR